MAQDSNLPERVAPGDPIEAAMFSRVLQICKTHNQLQRSFQSGALSVTRNAPGTGDDIVDASATKCWIDADIPALVWIDKANFKARPGILWATYDDTTDTYSGGVVGTVWGTKDFIFEPERKKPTGLNPAGAIVRRNAINVSRTDIRASSTYPIIGVGNIELVQLDLTPDDPTTNDLGVELNNDPVEMFVIYSVMDLRALPAFAADPDIQIPYRVGATEQFALGVNQCAS